MKKFLALCCVFSTFVCAVLPADDDDDELESAGVDTLGGQASSYVDFSVIGILDAKDKQLHTEDNRFILNLATESLGTHIDFTYSTLNPASSNELSEVAAYTGDTADVGITTKSYYGWFNHGGLYMQVGLFPARHADLLAKDKPSGLPDKWYEAYKPGVINGTVAQDSGDMTRNVRYVNASSKTVKYLDYSDTSLVNEDGELTESFTLEEQLAISCSYIWRALPGDFVARAVFVDGNWDASGTATVSATFAAELSYTDPSLIDVNAVFRSFAQDTFSASFFVSPLVLRRTATLFSQLDLLAGFSYGKIQKHDEFGLDLRMRWQLLPFLSLTTMHNWSHQSTREASTATFTNSTDSANPVTYTYNAHAKDALWHMLSLSYKSSDSVRFVLTGEFLNKNLHACADNTITFIPTVEVQCSKQVSVTAGNAIIWNAVGTSDAEQMTVQIPIICNLRF